MPVLSDVWRDISKYISIYTSTNFDEIPPCPGIYAWFYPLKVSSKNIEKLGIELSSILNYDSKLEGEQRNKAKINYNWKDIEVIASEEYKHSLPPKAIKQWDNVVQDGDLFYKLRQLMLVSSILMPPLYIGKTNDLQRRCRDHRMGSNQEIGTFQSRFEKFTREKKLINDVEFSTKSVDDLIFVCIRTDMLESENTDFEELLEEIFKIYSRPPYGKI